MAQECTFGAFVTIIRNYIKPSESDNRDFMEHLLASVMREPRTKEEQTLDVEGKYYPFSKGDEKSQKKNKNIVNQFFLNKNPRNLKSDSALFVSNHWDSKNFEKEIKKLPKDRKENLQREFAEIGRDYPVEKLPERLAILFRYIVDNLAGNKNLSEEEYFAAKLQNSKERRVPDRKVNLDDDELKIGGETIFLPIGRYSQTIEKETPLPYRKALFEAYGELINQKVKVDDVKKLPENLQQDYIDEKECFICAEAKRRSVREIFGYDGPKQCDILEHDMWYGIKDTLLEECSNGFQRKTRVMKAATKVQLEKSKLRNIAGLIGNQERRGICHVLINEGKFKSWVNPYD